MRITKCDKRSKLEQEIDSVLDNLSKLEKGSKEYAAIVDNLEKLYKAKGPDTKRCISPDTIAIVAGNLLGILIILGYEKTDVITSKAMGFILKGRV